MTERIELAPAPESVAAARRWSVSRSREAGWESASDTVALLVSELVTNVVLHARTDFELVLHIEAETLRVEVRDRNDALPQAPVVADPLASSGRGMFLLEALADDCGSDTLPGGGKVVWFQLGDLAGARADA